MSWKVRRAAAKCIEAVISTRHEMLAEFYRSVSPALISRFKGEQENMILEEVTFLGRVGYSKFLSVHILYIFLFLIQNEKKM